MPRFVILRHEISDGGQRLSHFDWMFEQDGVLSTWSIESSPGPGRFEASHLPPHRLHYLEYEGSISDNRGSVTRWDEGTYKTACGQSNVMEFEIDGQKLKGTARFQCTGAEKRDWTMDFLPRPS